MDVLSTLKFLKALTAVTPPAVTLFRSFTAKGRHLHEPVQGLNLNCWSITRLETEMPVRVISNTAKPITEHNYTHTKIILSFHCDSI
jgi:hypothetical protein